MSHRAPPAREISLQTGAWSGSGMGVSLQGLRALSGEASLRFTLRDWSEDPFHCHRKGPSLPSECSRNHFCPQEGGGEKKC